MNQSITSSIDENSEISTDINSKRILFKHVSTISIKSIEEKIESDSALIKNYEYDDETFDSSTKSSTKSSKSLILSVDCFLSLLLLLLLFWFKFKFKF